MITLSKQNFIIIKWGHVALCNDQKSAVIVDIKKEINNVSYYDNVNFPLFVL